MRVERGLLSAFILLMPCAAAAETEIDQTCYVACADNTQSNPELKACMARAADKADQALNEAYKALQAAVRRQANDMGQKPDGALAALTASQKKWIAYRDEECGFEDSLAFGGTATGGNYSGCLCALSLERVNDFARIRGQVIGE
jgi:uncharacterized protein YecT (DUF1311 family)